METSLDCRLLCASATAYHIGPDRSVDQSQPQYRGAGFVGDPPRGLLGGTNDINACLVGHTVDGVVLAFRGSLPLRFSTDDLDTDHRILDDWINDLRAGLVPGRDLPGLVHEGFLRSLDSLWDQVLPELTRERSATTPLFVTGHSKGGAIAHLAAMRLLRAGLTPTVRTFAAPHVGNGEFADRYAGSRMPSLRYEFADDLVPRLPPSPRFREMFAAVPFMRPYLGLFDHDYADVGELRYINTDGRIEPDSPLLRFRRYLHLAELLVPDVEFRRIVDGHNSDCGGPYMRALCPSGVCP